MISLQKPKIWWQ